MTLERIENDVLAVMRSDMDVREAVTDLLRQGSNGMESV